MITVDRSLFQFVRAFLEFGLNLLMGQGVKLRTRVNLTDQHFIITKYGHPFSSWYLKINLIYTFHSMRKCARLYRIKPLGNNFPTSLNKSLSCHVLPSWRRDPNPKWSICPITLLFSFLKSKEKERKENL